MPQCRIVPMATEDSDDRPLHNSFSAKIEYLDESMTVRELVQTLEDFAHQRGKHGLLLDAGVRNYLLGVLREHLPRRREAVV